MFILITRLLNHPYAQLMRLDKPVGIWLLMLPCWWGVLAYRDGGMPYGILALFALGALAMRSAGCIINDLTDREIDAQVARTKSRPLASGAVTPREAYGLIAALLVVALLVAIALGWKVVLLGACWLPLVVLYPRMKRITWWPQAFLGMTFGAGSLFGMVAMTGTIQVHGLLLYTAAICWVIGYDTIYACQDMEDDARIGVKSTARRFGEHIRFWVGGFFAAMLMLLIVACAPFMQFWQWGVLLLIALLLARQVWRLNPENGTLCLQLFKEHVWIGTLICLLCLSFDASMGTSIK